MMQLKIREIKDLRRHGPKKKKKKGLWGNLLANVSFKKKKIDLRKVDFDPEDFNYGSQFLDLIVPKLTTKFSTPEELVTKQGDDSNELYFIMQGDCVVNIINENRKEKIAV